MFVIWRELCLLRIEVLHSRQHWQFEDYRKLSIKIINTLTETLSPSANPQVLWVKYFEDFRLKWLICNAEHQPHVSARCLCSTVSSHNETAHRQRNPHHRRVSLPFRAKLASFQGLPDSRQDVGLSGWLDGKALWGGKGLVAKAFPTARAPFLFSRYSAMSW